MTYREYLKNCEDEMEKAIVVVNLARRCPNYDNLSPIGQRRELNRLLDMKVPGMDEEIETEMEL